VSGILLAHQTGNCIAASDKEGIEKEGRRIAERGIK